MDAMERKAESIIQACEQDRELYSYTGDGIFSNIAEILNKY